jgi:DNA-binding PadR family transcriptional regulator
MSKKSSYVGSLSPEYALLGFLAHQPGHGYELHLKLVTQLGQVWHISQSQVYAILKRLEQQGDLTGSVQEQARLPRRTCYALTPAGRRRFETWLDTPTGCSVRAIRVEFTTRLYFAAQESQARAEALIDAQVAETQAGLGRLQSLLSELPPDQVYNRLGLELRLSQLAAVLGWLECCRVLTHTQSSASLAEAA